MTNHTRGPRKGRIPPHIQDRVERKRQKRAERIALGPWYRRRWAVATAAALVALVAGISIGRVTAPDPVAEAAVQAGDVLGVADQIEVIWQGGTAQGVPPVAAALDQLRGAGDASTVQASLDPWLTGYDRLIAQLETGGVAPAGDGVRRLTLAAAQLSRDAVETLGAAAATEGTARELLLDQVERLRARAQAHDASARRLLALLRGEEAAEVPAPEVTPPSLPRPSPPAAEGSPPPQDSPAPEGDEGAAPEPSPAGS